MLKNILSEQERETLLTLIDEAENIIVCCHISPDGDAIGSTLGWTEYLQSLGKKVQIIVPDHYPDFLHWLPNTEKILRYDKHPLEADALIGDSDLVFCLDLNDAKRMGELGKAVVASQAKRVMIDHHLNPLLDCELTISHPEMSSTCELVFRVVWQLGGFEQMKNHFAVPVYCGMMTDTGNFAFSSVTPDTFRMVSHLAATGISIPDIHLNVYNSFTEGRARLFGYVINRKMKMLRKGTVAYMSLTEEEMRRFWFQQGDSEGFVNYPLTIKKMRMSAMFTEHKDFIRVSLRSRGAVDVNTFAARYFEGGGHHNAAGGKSYVSMAETIARFEAAVEEYAKEGLL